MNTKKICILVEQLNKGGAERASGLISSILSGLGYQVFIFIFFDDTGYPYEGKLINLGKHEDGSRSFKSKYGRYKQLHIELKEINPDLILDFRMKNFLLREILLNLIVFKYPIINMVRSYKLDWYFSKPKPLSFLIYRNYTKIISVSKAISMKIKKDYGFSNVATIYNAVDIQRISSESKKQKLRIEGDYILAVGRFDKNKQFKNLIESYAKSHLVRPKIKLLILGEGTEAENLKKKIKALRLESLVNLVPFQENPFVYMKSAKFLVLSSKHEGFPNVIIEALACGAPVVSFDCETGPNEIIEDRKNGLLVENQNFEALTEAMNNMVFDKELYQTCKENSKQSIERFSLENIKEDWRKLFDDIFSKDEREPLS
ncbi:glycosyltransferase [Mesonia sp. K7]|uniref:glycosyltransferase n=1 Tax=Mesonia sp. K7 TaxID=2218606 RepID=UPI000DA81B3B|nr:glycosyltransferase [Mesonia sp. K7]PZD78051.1 glycosyltransferase [Mesonia sp. K7]